MDWTESHVSPARQNQMDACHYKTKLDRYTVSHSSAQPGCGRNTIHNILGVIIDSNLSWSLHIAYLCKVVSSKVFQLSKIKHFLNFHARKLFFHAHIQACLDYGSTLWDLACVSTLKPLVSLHRRALKLIWLKSTSLTVADYKTLCILPLKLRFELNKGMFMYKIIFEIAPPYLKQLFQVSRLRGLNKITIMIPRSDLFKSSLTYPGAIL